MNTYKQILPISALVVALVLSACGGARTSFKEFSLDKCGIAMQLPSKPKEESRTAESSGIPFNITLYTATAGNSAYVVSCNDFPTDQVAASNLERVLDNIGQGAMSNIGATLDSQMIIELDGNPGRDIEGSAKIAGQNAIVRARVYLVGNRLIQTLVLGVRGQVSAADMTTYLSSLKLVK